MTFHQFIAEMAALGHDYTGDALYLPRGYQRRKTIHRFHRKNSRAATVAEINEHFAGYAVTVLTGAREYAPEQKTIFAVNRIFIRNK